MGYLGGVPVDAAVGTVRVPLPAVPSGQPVRVRDVLVNSGRVLDGEQVSTLAMYRRALRVLEQTAARFQPLADILMIAASQMSGAADALTGEPWTDPEHLFVTVVLQGEVLRCPRLAACRLAAHRSGQVCVQCPFPTASGVTLEGPSAVYAADATEPRVDDSAAAVRLAATLMHEYTHVALRRMYGNASLPWFEREGLPVAQVDRRIEQLREQRNVRVSSLMRVFDDMKPAPKLVALDEPPELRDQLAAIATDWCTYAAGESLRYKESVPYIAEAYFHEVRSARPDAVSRLFGYEIRLALENLIAPDFADMAAQVRGKGALTDR